MRSITLVMTVSVVVILTGMIGCAKEEGSGDVYGSIGEPLATQRFEFTVQSVEKADSYANAVPAQGCEFYDVRISITNTYHTTIPMGTDYFYIDDPVLSGYIRPIAPLDETMMPENYDFMPGASFDYRMLFEIPAAASEPVIMYNEIGTDGSKGTTFIVPINK